MRWLVGAWRRKKILHITIHELSHNSTNSQPMLLESYQPHYAVHDEKMKSKSVETKLSKDRLKSLFEPA